MEFPDRQIYSISMIDGIIHIEEYTGSPDLVDNVIDFDLPATIVHDSETLLVRARREDLEEVLSDEILSDEVLSEAIHLDKISIPVIQDGTAFADW